VFRGLAVALALLASLLVVPSASAAEVRTCLSYAGAETDCWNRERWRYQFCYDRAPTRAFLQRYVNGSWRLVTEKKLTRDTGCPPDYPWELKLSRKAKRDGAQRFRWVLQYGSLYADVHDNFTVSRTSR
jgi:hypothetical protein